MLSIWESKKGKEKKGKQTKVSICSEVTKKYHRALKPLITLSLFPVKTFGKSFLSLFV
jgi:hypothetical protein